MDIIEDLELKKMLDENDRVVNKHEDEVDEAIKMILKGEK